MRYISLEDLKKLDNKQLHDRWMRAQFPFDHAECSNCITLHSMNFCEVKKHEAFRALIVEMFGENYGSDNLLPALEQIYSLRLFYKDFYQHNPAEILTETSSVELETAESRHGRR